MDGREVIVAPQLVEADDAAQRERNTFAVCVLHACWGVELQPPVVCFAVDEQDCRGGERVLDERRERLRGTRKCRGRQSGRAGCTYCGQHDDPQALA